MSWGNNEFGQLGDGTVLDRTAPVFVLTADPEHPGTYIPLTGVVSISAGEYHSLAVLSHGTAEVTDDTVVAWGKNYYGELGDGTKTQSTRPVQVLGVGGVDYLTGVLSVAAGRFHSLALKSDGSVFGWGYNYYGQLGNGTSTDSTTPVQVKDVGGSGVLSGVSAIAAGYYHSLALKSVGTVFAWGNNEYGQLGDQTTSRRTAPVQVKGVGEAGVLEGVTAIAAGSYYSLALKSAGTVFAWGSDFSGQLGNGAAGTSYAPVQVLDASGSGFLQGVVSIAAGASHGLAAKADGSVFAWGNNFYGSLGNGITDNSHIPVQVTGAADDGFLGGVLSIAAGTYHSLALTSDGRVSAWGWNYDGQLGNNSPTWEVSTPVQVLSSFDAYIHLTDISKISAGESHTLALKSDGSRVYAWGDNYYGQLGDGTVHDSLSPVMVRYGTGYLTGVRDISAGTGHSLAILANGTESVFDDTVVAWGSNSRGQLGDGTTTSALTPVRVWSDAAKTAYLTGVNQISAGGGFSLAVLSMGTSSALDDEVKAWGYNGYGQLGIGTVEDSLTPEFVWSDATKSLHLSGVRQVAAGAYHALALMSNGTETLTDDTVKAWGYNALGELGNGTLTDSDTPVQVRGVGGNGFLTGISAIAAGFMLSLALTTSGTVYSWGSNTYGQLGINSFIDNVTTPNPVKGVGGVGFLTGVASISAGELHAIALKTDGTVYDWGWNYYGQLGNGTVSKSIRPVQVKGLGGAGFLSGITAISAGADQSFALAGDELFAWGSNTSGQLGTNSTINASIVENVVILSHAPFPYDETVNGIFDAQGSTFLYTGEYGFGQVMVTEVADVQYNNLVLQYRLEDYIESTLRPPTLESLDRRTNGDLQVLGEAQAVPLIDTAGAQRQLEENLRHAPDVMARLGDSGMHSFGYFFDPAMASRFTSEIQVLEGVVYVKDRGEEMNLLGPGEKHLVDYKSAKETPETSRAPDPTGWDVRSKEVKTKNPQEQIVSVPPEQKVDPKEVMWNPTKFVAAQPGNREAARAAGWYGTLQDTGKDVFYRVPGGSWQAAKDGMTILAGDEVRTAAGATVKVLLGEGTVGQVEVKEGSFFRINKMETEPQTGDKTTLLDLAIGKVLVHAGKLQGKSKFEVRTPQALVGVRGTIFEVEVKPKSGV